MIVQFLMVILGGLNSIFGGLIGAITLTGYGNGLENLRACGKSF